MVLPLPFDDADSFLMVNVHSLFVEKVLQWNKSSPKYFLWLALKSFFCYLHMCEGSHVGLNCIKYLMDKLTAMAKFLPSFLDITQKNRIFL
jgi:hypothetical protein